jgi:hypothetical protein
LLGTGAKISLAKWLVSKNVASCICFHQLSFSIDGPHYLRTHMSIKDVSAKLTVHSKCEPKTLLDASSCTDTPREANCGFMCRLLAGTFSCLGILQRRSATGTTSNCLAKTFGLVCAVSPKDNQPPQLEFPSQKLFCIWLRPPLVEICRSRSETYFSIA